MCQRAYGVYVCARVRICMFSLSVSAYTRVELALDEKLRFLPHDETRFSLVQCEVVDPRTTS